MKCQKTDKISKRMLSRIKNQRRSSGLGGAGQRVNEGLPDLKKIKIYVIILTEMNENERNFSVGKLFFGGIKFYV